MTISQETTLRRLEAFQKNVIRVKKCPCSRTSVLMPETHGVSHNSYNVNIKKGIKKKKDISMGEEQAKIFSVDISDVL